MEHVILADGNEMTVEIPKAEYKTLVEESITLYTLLCGIFKSAKLGWDKTDLTFNDRVINVLLSSMFPEEYEKRLADLQKEQEAADKEAADE